MLEAEKLAAIDKNTDIIIGSVSETEDSIKKALELVGDLRSKYSFTAFTKPNNEVPKKLNWPVYCGADDDIHNSSIWICHYEKIMLKLDMIEDYLIKGADRTAEAYEAVTGINRATGLTLTAYIESLEKEKAV